MGNHFKALCLVTSILFALLFAVCLFQSPSLVRGFGLLPSQATEVLLRRTSLFMAGISFGCLLFRQESRSLAREHFSWMMAFPLLGLAALGTIEWLRGTMSLAVMGAASMELALGVCFLGSALADRASRKDAIGKERI